MTLRAELERRASHTDQVEALFRSRPGQWVPVRDLLEPGGICGWRTRVSQCRQRFEREGSGTIEWNGDSAASAYRYVPRIAQAEPAQTSLFA